MPAVCHLHVVVLVLQGEVAVRPQQGASLFHCSVLQQGSSGVIGAAPHLKGSPPPPAKAAMDMPGATEDTTTYSNTSCQIHAMVQDTCGHAAPCMCSTSPLSGAVAVSVDWPFSSANIQCGGGTVVSCCAVLQGCSLGTSRGPGL